MRSDNSDDSRLRQLAASAPRFDRLSADEIADLVATGRHLTVPEHWALMQQQTPGDKAYLILDGQASVRHGRDEVAQIGPGEFIGEIALVRHTLRTATVVAQTPLEVLHFTTEDLAGLRERIPALERILEEVATERTGE